jgi:hypothetical protein
LWLAYNSSGDPLSLSLHSNSGIAGTSSSDSAINCWLYYSSIGIRPT